VLRKRVGRHYKPFRHGRQRKINHLRRQNCSKLQKTAASCGSRDRWVLHHPRGPRSSPGCSVPVRHHLSGPHPSPSQAHCDFTARRLIRNAFAVRERLGDPRAVPGFRCPFLPDMPSSTTPRSSTSISSRAAMSTRPSPRIERLGTPKTPANPFRAGDAFGASRFTCLLRPARLLAPLYGPDQVSRPTGACTSRLSTGRSPFPSLDMTTASTGLLC